MTEHSDFTPHTVNRSPKRVPISDSNGANAALAEARRLFQVGDYPSGIDLYEQLLDLIPHQAFDLLAELHDQFQKLPNNRYVQYVSRYFDFQIKPGDKVLDIGSGHDPFPFATHLADIAPDDNNYGRVGLPLKLVEGKPFFACGVEDMPFENKEFDFVYCSHVLEHTTDPRKACNELMRVAKRGYLETPSRSKDLWLNTAKVSNHLWKVDCKNRNLIFTRYSEEEKEGLKCNILIEMHCSPQTAREKAFSSLVLLKSREINTMLYWENGFGVEVYE